MTAVFQDFGEFVKTQLAPKQMSWGNTLEISKRYKTPILVLRILSYYYYLLETLVLEKVGPNLGFSKLPFTLYAG